MQDLPSFSFPYMHCPHGKNREIFSYYGSSGNFNTDQGSEVFFQRKRRGNSPLYTAVHPVLPLSEAAEDIQYPIKDRIIGDIINQRETIQHFTDNLHRLRSQKRKSQKTKDVAGLRDDVEAFKESNEKNPYLIECQLKPWFNELLKEYTAIHGLTDIVTNNYRYAGGVLAYLPGDIHSGLLLYPTGQDFTLLKLCSVSPHRKGLLSSDVRSFVEMKEPVYGVKGQKVQGQDQFLVHSARDVCRFKLSTDDGSDQLVLEGQASSPSGLNIVSTAVNPYIAGEYCFTTEDGSCYLTSTEAPDLVFDPCQPKFKVTDSWNQAHFGSHPRQLIFSDQSGVQIFDLRKRSPKGVDLFTIPCMFLHHRERVRQSTPHHASPFCHVVATDYTLFLTDERFPKHPVLQWDHMLATPPQYLTCLSMFGTRSDESAVYIGSQHPNDVHGFTFRVKEGKPPQAVGAPWRAASIRDISQWGLLTEECCNPALLHQRLSASLAGIQSGPHADGHVVFQIDCHGEVFHQVFRESPRETEDVTYSTGLGSYELRPSRSARERGKLWIGSWEANARRYAQPKGRILYKDVSYILQGAQNLQPAHVGCALCMPHLDLGDMAADREGVGLSVCLCCTHTLDTAREIVKSVTKDKIIPSEVPHVDISGRDLQNLDRLPAHSALSRLLLKHWSRETDLAELLIDWDKEVHEEKQKRKRKSKIASPGMDEQSVMDRLVKLAAQKSGENSALSSEPDQSQPGTSLTNKQTVSGSWDIIDSSLDGSFDDSVIESQINPKVADGNVIEKDQTKSVISSNREGAQDKEEYHSDISTRSQPSPSVTERDGLSQQLVLPHSHPSFDQSTPQEPLSPVSNRSASLFSSPDLTDKGSRKRKRHSSASSDATNVSLCSFPGFLASPRPDRKVRERHHSQEYRSDLESELPGVAMAIQDKSDELSDATVSLIPGTSEQRFGHFFTKTLSSPKVMGRSRPQEMSSPLGQGFSGISSSPGLKSMYQTPGVSGSPGYKSMYQQSSQYSSLSFGPFSRSSQSASQRSPMKAKRRKHVDGF